MEKRLVSADGMLPHEIPMSLVVGSYVLSSNKWVKRKLGYKGLGQACYHLYYVMANMKNYIRSPSVLPLLGEVPIKISREALQAEIPEPEVLTNFR